MSSDQAAAGSGAAEASATFYSPVPTTTMSEASHTPLPAMPSAEDEPILRLLEAQNAEEAQSQSQYPATSAPNQPAQSAHDYSGHANPQSQIPPPPGQQAHYPPPTSMSSPQAQNSLNATSSQHVNNPYNHGQTQVTSPHSMNMGAPSITQYYAEMPGGMTSDGFELVNDGGRHKKDVKRRTKTGCLTCRKRRIKCDERHPICRNCEKSKRDCLGYDPVFRSQPGPSILQPAPSQQPSLQVAPQNPHSLATSGTSHLTSGASSASPSVRPNNIPSTSPPGDQFDFASPAKPTPSEGIISTCPPPVDTFGTPDYIPMATALPETETIQMSRPTLEGLLAMGGHPLPNVDVSSLAPSRVEEVKQLYVWYSVGMDKLLECNWFQEKGVTYAMASPRIVGFYSALLDGFYDPKVHDPAVIARLESLEARIVWESLCLCRTARAQEPAKDGNTGAKPDPQLVYAVKRLSILEALMTGTILENNPLARHHYPEDDPSVPPPGIAGQIKNRELQFWESMGDYLVTSNEDPNANLKRDHALLMARAYLDTLENRDVIYSIGIVRHISKFKPKKFKLPTATDEKDAAAKLYVACRFLEDEVNGKATSQTIKRLCMLIVKYWDDPSNQ